MPRGTWTQALVVSWEQEAIRFGRPRGEVSGAKNVQSFYRTLQSDRSLVSRILSLHLKTESPPSWWVQVPSEWLVPCSNMTFTKCFSPFVSGIPLIHLNLQTFLRGRRGSYLQWPLSLHERLTVCLWVLRWRGICTELTHLLLGPWYQIS